jgi:hypothetical protein
MEQVSPEYTIIPFAKPVSKKPICTFVNSNISNHHNTSDIDTKVTKNKLKYSFTKEELSMSNIELQTYMKYNNFSNEQKLEYKKARRRYNNCIYSQRAREKRKHKKSLLTNTLNDSIIIEQDVQDEQIEQIEQIEQDEHIEQDEQDEHEIIEELPDLIHYTYISYITYIYI